METMFIKLFNLSIQASVLIVAVVLIRYLFRKSPKWMTCLLWGIVAIRLIFPFSLESTYSLAPRNNTIDISTTSKSVAVKPKMNSGISVVDDGVNKYIAERLIDNESKVDGSEWSQPIFIVTVIWIMGMAAIMIYAAVSYVKVWKRTRFSINTYDNVYICDGISSPFIMGILKPRIYIPSHIGKIQEQNIIAHEKAHLIRRDNLWKPIGFLLLMVYWFNLICWLAYILFCRDIELACDERVIRDMDAQQKKRYSEVLFAFSDKSIHIFSCPLAFGEVGVKERIRSILNYKKPAFWIIIVMGICIIAISFLFLTSPKNESDKYVTSVKIGDDMVTDGEGVTQPEWNLEGKSIFYQGENVYELSDIDTSASAAIDMGMADADSVGVVYFTDQHKIKLLFVDKAGTVKNQSTIDYTQYGGAGEVYVSFYKDGCGYILYNSDANKDASRKILWKFKNEGDEVEQTADLTEQINGHPTQIQFDDENDGMVLTKYEGDNSYAYKSEDAGLTWTPYGVVNSYDYTLVSK